MNGEIIERRSGSRVQFTSYAVCTKKFSLAGTETFEPPIEVLLVNVSEEGLSIRTNAVFKEREIITLDILLEGETYNGVSGKILWHIKESDGFHYGINVDNMSGRLFTHAHKIDTRVSNRV